MKTIIRLEEIALTMVGMYALFLHHLGLPLWLWVILFFTPDISMLGYVINNKAGAITYNLFHHRGIALLLAAAGFYWANEVLLAVGLLMFTHASFDRIFGYGLKYFSGFKDTHLGSLKKPDPTLPKIAA